jgi:hypothetical protein
MLKKQTNNLKLKQNSTLKMASVDQLGKITYFHQQKRCLKISSNDAFCCSECIENYLTEDFIRWVEKQIKQKVERRSSHG